MRKLIFMFVIMLGAVCIIVSCRRSANIPTTSATLYFVDSEINRLLPYEDEIPLSDTEHMAQSVVIKLINGRDDNEKIRRLLPKDKHSVSVYVKDNIAYIDLKSDIADNLPQSRDIERLIIYQIVNTVTDIKGIRFVRFTVDGQIHKSFMGFFDMRETFKFQYPE